MQISSNLVQPLNPHSAHSPPIAVGYQGLQRLPLHTPIWHSAKDVTGPLCTFLEVFGFFVLFFFCVCVCVCDFCLILSPLLFCPANSSHLRSPERWSLSPQFSEIAVLPLGFSSVPWSRRSLQAGSWSDQRGSWQGCHVSQSCTSCSSRSGNCCFMYFVQLYS